MKLLHEQTFIESLHSTEAHVTDSINIYMTLFTRKINLSCDFMKSTLAWRALKIYFRVIKGRIY